jgi:hypothetical protein
METHAGSVPVRYRILDPSLFAGAKRFIASGSRVGLLEFEIERFGPGAADTEVAARVEQRIEELAASFAPPPVLEHWREKRRSLEGPSEQRVYFRTSTARSTADYVAQVVLAAAYALACDGTLHDPQDWGKAWPPDPGTSGFGHTRSGEEGIVDALSRQLRHGPLCGKVEVIPGPPRLALAGPLDSRPWTFSDPVGEVTVPFRNHGGAATGVHVVCASDLVSKGAIVLREAVLFEGSWELGRVRHDATRGFVFADIRLPPGIDPQRPTADTSFVCTVDFEVRTASAALLRFKFDTLKPTGEALAIGRLATVG